MDSKIKKLLKNAVKAPIPRAATPMLATLVKDPFDDDAWTYEVKWDGYRILAYLEKKEVILYSRSKLNYTKQYAAVAEAVKAIKYDAIIDGEIVLINEKGLPDFDALQSYRGEQQLVYYAFDLLWLDGFNLVSLPLLTRKEILKYILPANETIRFSEEFASGTELFEQAINLGLEGIVAKKKDSFYSPGKRTNNWLKIPTAVRQEFVIGGWTESENARPFRSLLFGYFENKKLHFVGHAGLGFKEKGMQEIIDQLRKLETKKNPFVNEVDYSTTPHWVRPLLVAEIKYATWTKFGKIRKPAIFLGFRKDKKASDVVKEEVKQIEVMEEKKKQKATPSSSTLETPDSNWKIIRQQKIISEAKVNIDGNELLLTNVEKDIWKGIPKAELIEYYHNISPYILPHIKDRPQSMHIKHIGATRPGFYIKDMEGNEPPFATIYSVARKHKKVDRRDVIDYLVCQNEATLLYMVNLGCIDINPWTSTIHHPYEPDFITIDLDPSDNDFTKAVETALAAKEFFSKMKLSAIPKTSGKTGIHLFIPCTGFDFKQARAIAVQICEEIHRMLPEITTTEMSIDHRGNKLYIDPNQNDEADTLAAVYSVRPHTIPCVSTPLLWKEIKPGLTPEQFTIKTIEKRLNKLGDVFEAVVDRKIAEKNSIVLQTLY